MACASEWINGSNTICHYTRFSGFSEPNCNGCNVGYPEMVELLHQFAENGLVADQSSMEWNQIPADRIVGTLAAALPICFACHTANRLVKEHPDLVTERHRAGL